MKSLLEDSRRPDITFHSSGRIDITARLVRALSIGRGDTIDVQTDGVEYMLYVRHRAAQGKGSYEAQCYPTNSGRSHNYRCHSLRLCKALINAVMPSATILRLPAGDPVVAAGLSQMAVPLITRHPL